MSTFKSIVSREGSERSLWRWLRRALMALTAVSGIMLLGVTAWVVAVPFPQGWFADSGRGGVKILDRHGTPLREMVAADGLRSTWVSMEQISPWLVDATLASEDHRFESHVGVDPWAVTRAVWLLGKHAEAYSGASTLTMQLVRMVWPDPPPRTVGYKLEQAVLALRLENQMGKERILLEYLNRLPYGNGARGAQAASRLYLNKDASALTLAESAFLAALPRGPSWYNPYRHPQRAIARQRHILGLMRQRGQIDAQTHQAALSEPLNIHNPRRPFKAPHFVDHVVSRHPELMRAAPSVIHTTVDLNLQEALEDAVEAHIELMTPAGATQAAVVVVDNATGHVLGMVGARDWHDRAAQGQFNGATAMRPSGSILGPFVYAAAFENEDATLSTVLADVPVEVTLFDGRRITPRNHDGRRRGPVLVRTALAGNLEVPTTAMLDAIGNEPLLELLDSLGMTGLDRPDARYGLIRPEGLGRVSLLGLTQAYTTLASGGQHKSLQVITSAHLHAHHHGTPLPRLASPSHWRPQPTAALSETTAAMITQALADEEARQSVYGTGSVLEMPMPAAVVTGHSDGRRDVWAMGYTPEVTVGVWVGRFDGQAWDAPAPHEAAGPLLRASLMAAMSTRSPSLFEEPQQGLVTVDICPLSGKQAGPQCPHSVEEHFASGQDPTETCQWHVQVALDKRNGLQASPTCQDTDVVLSTFVRYPDHYHHWLHHQGRRPLTTGLSPLCSVSDTAPDPSPANPLPLFEAPARWPAARW